MCSGSSCDQSTTHRLHARLQVAAAFTNHGTAAGAALCRATSTHVLLYFQFAYVQTARVASQAIAFVLELVTAPYEFIDSVFVYVSVGGGSCCLVSLQGVCIAPKGSAHSSVPIWCNRACRHSTPASIAYPCLGTRLVQASGKSGVVQEGMGTVSLSLHTL